MANGPRSGRRPMLPTAAGCDERREALAEAGRRQRRLERLAGLADLAPAERPLFLAQLDPLPVEALAEQGELALPRLEPGFEAAQLAFALLVDVRMRRRGL